MAPFRDLLQQRLRQAYQQLPAAVASEERAPLAAALTERRVKLETAEESLVLLAETQGIALSRRPDADPRIVATTLLQA
jgi:hypothetical protein